MTGGIVPPEPLPVPVPVVPPVPVPVPAPLVPEPDVPVPDPLVPVLDVPVEPVLFGEPALEDGVDEEDEVLSCVLLVLGVVVVLFSVLVEDCCVTHVVVGRAEARKYSLYVS